MDPWGTRTTTDLHDEFCPLKTTNWNLLDSKYLRWLQSSPKIPIDLKLYSKSLCQTLLKHLEYLGRQTNCKKWILIKYVKGFMCYSNILGYRE